MVDISNALVEGKKLGEKLGLYNRRKNTKNEQVKWREIRWIRMERFGYMKYKTTFEPDAEWSEVCLLNPRRVPDVDLDSLKKVAKRAVANAKIADLEKQKPHIPRYAWGFYEAIEGTDVVEDDA